MTMVCEHVFEDEQITVNSQGEKTASKRCVKCGEWRVRKLPQSKHFSNHYKKLSFGPEVRPNAANTSSTASGPPSPQGEG